MSLSILPVINGNEEDIGAEGEDDGSTAEDNDDEGAIC